MLRSIRTLFLATRPMFFPASLIPVVVGTLWGCRQSQSLWAEGLVLSLLGMACLHAGANVLNDVGDEMNGCDRHNEDHIHPFTGGSRFIQEGYLSVRAMTALGMGLLGFAALLGLTLMSVKGQTILYFGLLGLGLGAAYSFPPFVLASRGLGELAVAVAFGTPVAACAWLQGGLPTPEVLLASAAVGGWTAAILIINEVPDLRADAGAGKRTLVVRLGLPRARWLYLGVQGLAATAVMAIEWRIGLPQWTLLVPAVLFAAAVFAGGKFTGNRSGLVQAIKTTLAIHLVGGLSLALMAGWA